MLFVLIVASVASCTAYQNKVDDESMLEMIRYGADPIGAKCAVKGSSNSECAIIAAKLNIEKKP